MLFSVSNIMRVWGTIELESVQLGDQRPFPLALFIFKPFSPPILPKFETSRKFHKTSCSIPRAPTQDQPKDQLNVCCSKKNCGLENCSAASQKSNNCYILQLLIPTVTSAQHLAIYIGLSLLLPAHCNNHFIVTVPFYRLHKANTKQLRALLCRSRIS